jgi:hypothetical protein
MSSKPSAAEKAEEQRRARILPHVDRASRVAAMLDRWAAEDADGEPEWDVSTVERVGVRSPSP